MSAKRISSFVLAASILFGAGLGLGRHAGGAVTLPTLESEAQAQESQSAPTRRTGATPDLLSFSDVAEQVTPSVVTVRADKKAEVDPQQGRPPQFPYGDDFFHFFQWPRGRQHGLGSGFVVDRKGLILTNNHVVDGADRIVVRMQDGREFPAKVVGTDPKTDIAVLRVDAGDLPAAKLGDDKKLRVGEWVLAVGSPLGPQYEHSVTAGIISAKSRSGLGLADYEDYLQTDAAINPGNSGGPLVNLHGEVIGINSAIASGTGGYQGLSFAIPISMAQDIMAQLVANGKVTRAWLGVSIQDITPDIAHGLKIDSDSGILVGDVVKGGPADRAGIQDGDVIVSMDGQPTGSMQQFRSRVARTKPGSRTKIEVMRDDHKRTFDVTLDEMPDDRVAASSSKESDAPESDLGIQITNVTPTVADRFGLEGQKDGVVVTGVEPGSPAADAGLRPGDVLRSVNRKRVTNVRDIKEELSHIPAKDPVVLQVMREDRTFYVSLTRDS